MSSSLADLTLTTHPTARLSQRSGWLRFAGRVVRNRKALVGGSVVGLVVFCGLFADVIAPYDPLKQNVLLKLKPPLLFGGSPEYILGTDPLGRDMLSRMIHGARVSLIVGLLSVLVQATIGWCSGWSSDTPASGSTPSSCGSPTCSWRCPS